MEDLVVAEESNAVPMSGSGVTRECGNCTACCTVLAVHELNKPGRWACDHQGCGGCRVYDARPASCREFDCLWLRGEMDASDDRRPDRLGVIFDWFYSPSLGRDRYVAFEVWTGAFNEPRAAEILNTIATERELELSYRDGMWRTIGTAGTVPQSA